MTELLLAQVNLITLLQTPWTWGFLLAGLGLWVILQVRGRRTVMLGRFIATTGLVVLAIALPKLSALETGEQWVEQITFWLLAAVAIGCSGAAVTSRNPVYTAIWFAGSLVGVAGLFLFQHAQFLGFATIVVYAGAIVVTFLFVLMLANPEGQASYDRISWAKFPTPLMVLGATLFVILVAQAYFRQPPGLVSREPGVVMGEHVAHFGGELFAKHMISVEVAGTILLVALVGAIAIVIQGKDPTRPVPSGIDTLAGRKR